MAIIQQKAFLLNPNIIQNTMEIQVQLLNLELLPLITMAHLQGLHLQGLHLTATLDTTHLLHLLALGTIILELLQLIPMPEIEKNLGVEKRDEEKRGKKKKTLLAAVASQPVWPQCSVLQLTIDVNKELSFISF
eukprot:TRINITY_DN3660_c0_g2_i3.p2 TRINITY_DN3660_c0_g2~~TRINITY_DN3660_c0_g2_i3.p2  ORF type:complete len:134 (+),score=21.17 TRINITY_DN3660_c0_g2_i3:166-567(+)